MATKPPSPVAEFPTEALEKIAYTLVENIPTQEPNDRNRLGYNIWIWLREGKGSLEQAVKISGVRSEMEYQEIAARIKQNLKEKGIKHPED